MSAAQPATRTPPRFTPLLWGPSRAAVHCTIGAWRKPYRRPDLTPERIALVNETLQTPTFYEHPSIRRLSRALSAPMLAQALIAIAAAAFTLHDIHRSMLCGVVPSLSLTMQNLAADLSDELLRLLPTAAGDSGAVIQQALSGRLYLDAVWAKTYFPACDVQAEAGAP